jgi:hypothetical protein
MPTGRREATPGVRQTRDAIRGLEATAAASYFYAWVGHPAVVPRFATADQRRVPSAWMHYDGRRSLLSKGNSNRRGATPINVLLNVLYRLAAIETRLACLAVGLDPSFRGAAPRRRQSGLASPRPPRTRAPSSGPLRPRSAGGEHVHPQGLHRAQRRLIRIGPALSQRLSSTMPIWAKAVAPYAEQVAHTFGQLVSGKWALRTPLTSRNARSAAAVVKARKQQAVAKGRRSAVTRGVAPKREASDAARTFASCVDCGGRLERARHLRCRACWENQPGQSDDVRQRRGQAIAESRSAQERWRRDNPDAETDPDVYRNRILPGLAAVPLRKIIAVTGSSKSSASAYRSGRSIPHPMNWAALATLASHSVR